MVLREIVESIADKFYSNNEENLLYFSIPGSLMNQVKDFAKEDVKIIDLAKDFSPVKPFLGILSLYNPSERLVVDCTYPLHTNAFISYFKSGIVDRRLDLFITEEIFYEKLKIQESVLNLIERIVDGHFIILNAQLLPEESIQIVKKLIETKTKGKFILVFNCTNMEENSDLDEFYQNISNDKNFFEITDYEESLAVVTKEISEKKPNFETINNFLTNCRHFLAFDQAVTFLKWFESNIDSYRLSKKQQRIIYLQSGLVYYRAGYFDQATYYLSSIIDAEISDELEISALYGMCQINYERNCNAVALRYANQIKSKLIEDRENPFYSLAVMMDYIITQKSDAIQSVSRYERTLDLLERQCLFNNYLYTLMVVPWQTLNDYDTPYNMMPKIERAIEIAEMLKNDYALSTAYNWKGILLLHNGKTKEAPVWYEKCNELRTKIGDIYPIMKIRNGLSYEYLISTKFRESYDLVNSYIGRISEIRDNAEIIITLGNVANALFYSRHLSDSYVYFQKMIHLLCLFDLEKNTVNSFLPEYNDILTYKTYVDLDAGFINRVKINYHLITNNGRPVTTINSPVKYLIKAVLCLEEKNLSGALAAIEECDGIFAKFSSSQNYRHVFIYYEFAHALKKRNYLKEADDFFKKGFEIAKNSDLKYYTLEKNSLSIDEYFDSIEPFPQLTLNLSMIDEKSEKEKLLSELQKRLKDSQFLNKIMSFGSASDSGNNYAQTIVEALQDYVSAEGIYVAEKKGDEWKLIAQLSKVETIPPTQETWKTLGEASLSNDPSNPLVYVFEKKIFYANISKYDFEGAIIIEFADVSSLPAEEMSVLNIAISNIQSQLIMRNQNEHLLYISSTDQLSMLKNRRALEERLSEECDSIKRVQSKGKKPVISVAFMDLDNFKNINDTFGHEAGDMVISRFAGLLKEIYRKVDFISRFGGDEFVVLLPNTNCKEAQRAAERLLEGLRKADCFIPDLEKLLKKNIFIKDNQKLGFSMGICSNLDLDDISDMEKVLVNADRALYHSKENGKGIVTMWSDIKEKYMD